MNNLCCFVYITSLLLCVYYMYNHCCFEINTTIKPTGPKGEVNIVPRSQNYRTMKVLFISDSLVIYCNLLNKQDESFTMYFLHHIGPDGFRKLYLPGWACHVNIT